VEPEVEFINLGVDDQIFYNWLSIARNPSIFTEISSFIHFFGKSAEYNT
jgi:hypothetical protein